jgi:hypothetical protein
MVDPADGDMGPYHTNIEVNWLVFKMAAIVVWWMPEWKGTSGTRLSRARH